MTSSFSLVAKTEFPLDVSEEIGHNVHSHLPFTALNSFLYCNTGCNLLTEGLKATDYG
jgi:hypothetical protein